MALKGVEGYILKLPIACAHSGSTRSGISWSSSHALETYQMHGNVAVSMCRRLKGDKTSLTEKCWRVKHAFGGEKMHPECGLKHCCHVELVIDTFHVCCWCRT